MPDSRIFFRRTLAALTAGFCLVLSPGMLRAQEALASPLADRDEVVHVLNRITFGPRPGDVEAVQKMGVHAFIEQQLHPETIDDSAVEQQLAGFDLLQMSPEQLSALFLNERKNAQKKQKKLAEAANLASNPTMTPPAGQQVAQGDVEPPPAPPQPELSRGDKLKGMVDKANQYRSVAAIGQLEQAKLVRAVDSNRQLQEVLVDFWSNHFNIDVKKGPDRVLKVVDDRDVIRPHIWGNFRDLLEASAKSPAMLFYLDNATNTVARTVTPSEAGTPQMLDQQMTANGNGALGPARCRRSARRRAASTKTTPARSWSCTPSASTAATRRRTCRKSRAASPAGRSTARPANSSSVPGQHDNGAKVVLGHIIPAGGGMQDGETVLDILASQPRLARTSSRCEMCQRFVSDDPPAGAGRPHRRRLHSRPDGDLRQVTEAILTSPEFLSPSNYNNKIKSPLEFAVSAVRASDSTIIAAAAAALRQAGADHGRRRRSSAAAKAADRLSPAPAPVAQLAHLRAGRTALRLHAADRLQGSLQVSGSAPAR